MTFRSLKLDGHYPDFLERAAAGELSATYFCENALRQNQLRLTRVAEVKRVCVRYTYQADSGVLGQRGRLRCYPFLNFGIICDRRY